ncbi:galactokinase family protein [Demequina sp.]|uniref:galactokinase n=1 Tax=Demequina sp. TaxID=2050685 RepID=UPI0025BE85F0|nr:galactokinase family protein [Demequina sp.]
MPVSSDLTEPRWTTAWSLDEGERRARARMRQAFGVEARHVWSAPGRLNIVGEYTDISQGVSLPTPIPHRTFVAAARRSDRVVRLVTDRADAACGDEAVWEGDLDSLQSLVGEDCWMAYPAGVLWALIERGFASTGIDLAFASCVPLSAGLSASTSLTAATALAANGLWGLALATDITAVELADVCIDAENEIAGGATAGLAQHAIMRGAPGEALHLDFATSPPRATGCPLTFAEYGLGLLVIDTGVPHPDQNEMVRERMAQIGRAAAALGVESIGALRAVPGALARIEAIDDPILRKRARHVFTENERVEVVRDELTGTAPAHERFVAVGKAMYRSHASLETDFDVSCEPLNLAVDQAFRAGALGARLTGSGRGGSAVALIRRAQATGTARLIDAAFVAGGLPRPAFAFF